MTNGWGTKKKAARKKKKKATRTKATRKKATRKKATREEVAKKVVGSKTLYQPVVDETKLHEAFDRRVRELVAHHAPDGKVRHRYGARIEFGRPLEGTDPG